MRKHLSAKQAVRALAIIFSLLPVLLGYGCASAPEVRLVESESWQTYLGDSERSNISKGVVTLPPDSSWSSKVTGIVSNAISLAPSVERSSPIIYNDMLFIGSASNSFHAFSLKTGKRVWEFKTGSPVEGSATINDSLLCFGTSGGTLYCLDALTGEESFRYQVTSDIIAAPFIENKRVYFLTTDNRLIALSARTEEPVWSYTHKDRGTVTTRLTSSFAISGDTLYVLFSTGELVAINKEDGKRIWTTEILSDTKTTVNGRRTPMYRDGTIYIIDNNGSLLAVDAETGRRKIRYEVTTAVDFIVTDNSIIIAGTDEVVSINKASASVIWSVNLKEGSTSSIFAAGKYLFVLTNKTTIPFEQELLKYTKGYLSAYTLDKGALSWTKKFKDTVTANAGVADGHIAVFTDNDKLTTFSSK